MNPNNISKKLLPFFIFLIVLMPQVFAAGGGGGGSYNQAPKCTEDTWSCNSWSECQKNGTQSRACYLVEDCSDVATPKPKESEQCAYVSQLIGSLKCHNLATIKERVNCRLGLTDADLKKELQIAYLPEECRAMSNDADKEDCVLLYSKSQKCWRLPIGDSRNKCLKEVLGIKDIKQEKQSCTNPNCFTDLRKKVYALIKFQFYDLEERAEELYEKGLMTKEKAAEIISKLEEKKIAFNNASSKDERKQIISETKKLWLGFISELKSK